jgi:NTP pyrophosphatase (non-canonical NTP hydrolase)
MDLSELTRKMDAFVDSKGWYSPGSSRPQTPRNLAISLSLESNEVLEHFQWGEEIIDKQELANELADVALFLFQLSSVAGVDLERAILEKLDANAAREWN